MRFPFRRITDAARPLALFCFFAFLVAVPPSAQATLNNGEPATDILGQFDSATMADSPADYVKGCYNDGASPFGFSTPTGGTIDATNHWLFIADGYNNRVLVFPLNSNNTLASKTPSYVLGQTSFTDCNPNQGGTEGQSTLSLAVGNKALINGPAVDPVNYLLYVPDYNNDRILVFSTASMSNGEHASYVIGATDFAGDCAGCTGQNGLGGPEGLSLDPVNHLLYVADSAYDASRVMVFPAYGNANWSGTGENALYVIGQSNFSNEKFQTTQSGLRQPDGVLVDTANDLLYVADSGNNRVMVFPAYGNASWGGTGESALYEIGQTSGSSAFTSNAAAETQSGLNAPISLALDSADGLLFVSDSGNSRVMIFPAPVTGNGENASFVLGTINFTSGGGGYYSGFQNPGGLAYDSTNSLLYVADVGDPSYGGLDTYNRVMIFKISLAVPTVTGATQGGDDACAVAGGALYCWGGNAYGELGLGNTTQYNSPQQVGSATNWITVSQGDPFANPAACGIAGSGTSGALYCWGDNYYGEVGNGTTTQYDMPQQVGSDTTWTAVSTSGSDTCGIDNGKLYCWGINTYGEDGQSNTTQYTTPQLVSLPSGVTSWTAVSTGGTDTCAIANTGALYCWGENAYGEDGTGPVSNTVFMTSTTYNGDFGATAAAAITAANSDCQARATAAGLSGTFDAWIADSSRNPSSEFIHSTSPYEEVDGTVIASNWTGLVSGTLTNGITLSATGATVSGDAWTNVATGGGVETSASSATANCAAWSNGTSSDTGYYGDTGSTTSTWTYASGDTATCSTAGHLYCFQQNANPAEQNSPVQVGTDTTWTAVSQGNEDTCGIDNGKLFCWGYNHHGELGLGNTTQYNSPQQVGSDTTWTAVSILNDSDIDGNTGLATACGIDNGKLFCWGQNGYGQLGLDNTTAYNTPQQVGSATNWTAVSYGVGDTCGIAANQLYCWGRNGNGEDAQGTTNQYDTPQPVYLGSMIGENATDLLGQYTSATSPATVNWTQTGPNNGPNMLGFINPTAAALDPVNHSLYVYDLANNRVLVYPLNIDNSISAASGGHTASYAFSAATVFGGSLGIDTANNRLFVAAWSYGGLVAVYSTPISSNSPSEIAQLGQEFADCPTQANACEATDVAYDPVNQNLYVADPGDNRVMIYNVPPGFTSGENASYEFGQPSGANTFTTYASATTQSGMNGPFALAYDAVNQRLFVADQNNNRVLVFSTASLSDGPNAIAVIGQSSFTASASACTQSGMNDPNGVSYDPNNNRLFVADGGNNRILVFNAGPSVLPANGASAVYVIGQSNFTSCNANTGSTYPTQSGLSLLSSGSTQKLSYDPGSGRLFVPDGNNNRVMIFKADALGGDFFKLLPD